MKGWTQQQLAEAAGVTLGTVSDLERGAREPRPGTMARIARALGVRIPDIDEFAAERPAPERAGGEPPTV
jgi:transcriptional regulator with XRE-family HTH domain